MDLEAALKLADKIASGQYQPDELDRFLEYIDSAGADEVNRVLDAYKLGLDLQEEYPLHVRPDFMNRLKALRPSLEEPVATVLSIERRRSYWPQLRVAAVILLAIGTGFYYVRHAPEKEHVIVQIAAASTAIKAPQTTRAMITLSDGRKLSLDSVATGSLISQGGVRIVKLADGRIAYQGNTTAVMYNTLTNPRGSKPVSVTLSDGSIAWLNAGSSLSYPMAFTGKERVVEIAGEGYFEVAHNSSMPFLVKLPNGAGKILVLGTRFNVNAYSDEASVKVSLLEGSVNVSHSSGTYALKPGQQAQLDSAGARITNDADMDEVMAWKKGKFHFGEKMDIYTIMRQISRWYDVEIRYEGNVHGHIGGSISLDTDVSQVLRMLESTGGVHFKVEGRQVTVLP